MSDRRLTAVTRAGRTIAASVKAASTSASPGNGGADHRRPLRKQRRGANATVWTCGSSCRPPCCAPAGRPCPEHEPEWVQTPSECPLAFLERQPLRTARARGSRPAEGAHRGRRRENVSPLFEREHCLAVTQSTPGASDPTLRVGTMSRLLDAAADIGSPTPLLVTQASALLHSCALLPPSREQLTA